MSQINNTAESFCQKLQNISDEQLKRDYLNRLEWTEIIAQALPLLDDEAQALRVVRFALEIDLCLGAKLAGAVKPQLQNTTVDWLISTGVSQELLVRLLGMTRDAAIPYLCEVLNDEDNEDDCVLLNSAAKSLAEIGTEAAVTALTQVMNDEQKNDFGYYLSEASWQAALALENINSESAKRALVQWYIELLGWIDFRSYAAEMLSKIATPEIVPELLKIVEDDGCDDRVQANIDIVLSAIDLKASITTQQPDRSNEDELDKRSSQPDLITLQQLLNAKTNQFVSAQ
ncbi:MAG: hypothetical protein N2235_13605 [Fischerella sp.]|nr:hypothetical protein [Fischerella sp.]